MLDRPMISGTAVGQLAAWEALAEDWPSYPDRLGKVELERCGKCHVGLYRRTDEHGYPYRYGEGQIMVQIVAHLRQCHMELDPDR